MNINKKLVFWLWIFFFIFVPKSQSKSHNIHDSIRTILLSSQNIGGLFLGCQSIYSNSKLKDFYQNRKFEPIWITHGKPSNPVFEFLSILVEADSHGLNRENYHFSCIQKWLTSINQKKIAGEEIEINELAGFDIMMTDAFLNFGFHLARGKIDPENIFPQWRVEKSNIDIFNALNCLCVEKIGVETVLRQLTPTHADYQPMIKAAKFLKILQDAGGWPVIPTGKLLCLGDTDSRIILLRQRLEIEGYLPYGLYEEQNFFDRAMADAVKRFQARHGLKIDGMVGPNTLKELNVSAGERQKQIIINLERLRWLPRNLGARHIRVNIAAFTLDAIRKKEKKVSMRVIVGKAYNETPLFSKKIGYIEFNPYWNVPRSIAVEELLPKIKSDAGYITNNHYELVAGWAPESPVLNSDYIDWKSVDETNFPGRIRQLPGPWNTMGRVKIMFPNSYDVYLHDTPSKYLFQRVDRALSHGCIRAEKPIDLAVFLLSDNPKWSRKHIEAIIKSGNHHAVPITSQCTIHLLYHTAWVDNEQKINYRRDIYGRDRILWEALQKELSYDSIPKAVVTMVP